MTSGSINTPTVRHSSSSHVPQAAGRYRGALLGLAAGDALGTTLEFCPRDKSPLHTEMLGGGTFGVAPGVVGR